MQVYSTCGKDPLVAFVLYNSLAEGISDFCNSLPLSTKLLSGSGGLRAEIREVLLLHTACVCSKLRQVLYCKIVPA